MMIYDNHNYYHEQLKTLIFRWEFANFLQIFYPNFNLSVSYFFAFNITYFKGKLYSLHFESRVYVVACALHPVYCLHLYKGSFIHRNHRLFNWLIKLIHGKLKKKYIEEMLLLIKESTCLVDTKFTSCVINRSFWYVSEYLRNIFIQFHRSYDSITKSHISCILTNILTNSLITVTYM